VDLGAGDGTLLVTLARRLTRGRTAKRAILVDRQELLSPATAQDFQKNGWAVEAVNADVFEWLECDGDAETTVLIANLFLHHFEDSSLRHLLRLVSQRCCLFAACEPRRSALALIASRLVGLIGCCLVTRHDAVLSVRAGFTGRELSRLWPSSDGWDLREGAAGLFTHFFVATKE
jgi:hypothetical protein